MSIVSVSASCSVSFTSVSYTHLDVYKRQEPAGVQVSAPTGWQGDSAVVRFSGGTDTGTSLPDWSATPGDYGSGIHHYE